MKLYDGYLTEDKLEGVLNILYPKGEWIRGKQIPDTKRKFRPDYRNEYYKLIVEYDGHLHYTTAKGALNDLDKAETYELLGYEYFNLPYFIQIDQDIYDRILKYHRAERIKDLEFTDFPQGFISDQCVLPAEFCTAGLLRFALEIFGKYTPQREDILDSLEMKEKVLGAVLVKPLMPFQAFLLENEGYWEDEEPW